MNEDRLSILHEKLSKTPLDRIKSNLAAGNYASWKIPHVEEYLKQQEQNTWLYHEKKAYKGQIFKRYEVPKLIKQGWVDTPAKFGKGLRGKWYRLTSAIINAKAFYKKNWKVTVPLTVTIIIALVGFLIQLYIHFDTKKVNESKTNIQRTEVKEPSAPSKQ